MARSSPIDLALQRAARVIDDVHYEFDAVPKSCAINRAEGKLALEFDNWLSLALRGIEVVGVELRANKNEDASRRALVRAHEAAVLALDAFARYETLSPRWGPVFRSNLDRGIVVALLSQDYALAKKFAALTRHPSVFTTEGSGDHGTEADIAARLFAAVVDNDAGAFATWRPRFDHEAELDARDDPYWKKYYLYPSTMAAIFSNDREALAASLAEAGRLYDARSKDRQASQLQMADGPPPLNLVMIDYRATALGVLAASRGMVVEATHPAVPVQTLVRWPALS